MSVGTLAPGAHIFQFGKFVMRLDHHGPIHPAARFMSLPISFCRLLKVATFVGAFVAHGDGAGNQIRLNTVGYLPGAAKHASTSFDGAEFSVVRTSDGIAVLKGTLGESIPNADTGETLRIADFSALATPGEYVVKVEGAGASAPFRIDSQVYREAFRIVTRGMYLWRCGSAVSSRHFGDTFSHDACHVSPGWLDPEGTIDSRKDGSGGWHDAGDYNKYVVNAAITVGSMLRAWEDFGPEVAGVALGLPEQGGVLPEFLAEIKWEIDWLLKMQAEDGSVYHKLSTLDFGAMIPPDQEMTKQYFVSASSAATADLVATAAAAARCFSPYDQEYAKRCLAAARKSQNWLTTHPNNLRADQKAFKTGQYSTQDSDDRLWALAEFWESTGEADALLELESRIAVSGGKIDTNWDWGNVGNLGMFTYLFSSRPGRDERLLATVRGNVMAAADQIVATGATHGYARPLGDRYYWGCNGTVARQVMNLQAAWRLTGNRDYRRTAGDAVNHLLGRNVYGRSFITGVGHEPPLHPHDRRSVADAVVAPWPGYLIGGPNPRATDWDDTDKDYRTNEIAINWNGALIYALAAFLDEPTNSTPTVN